MCCFLHTLCVIPLHFLLLMDDEVITGQLIVYTLFIIRCFAQLIKGPHLVVRYYSKKLPFVILFCNKMDAFNYYY